MHAPEQPDPHAGHPAPPSPLRSEELVRRHRTGDSAAGRELFPRMEVVLRARIRASAIFRRLQPDLDEQDVLNELWRRLLERDALARFEDRGPHSLRAFLRAALDLTLQDLLRRRLAGKRGRPPLSLDETQAAGRMREDLASPGAGPVTVVLRRDYLEHLLAALPEREARVFELRAREGLDFEAIGARLGLSAAAARGLAHRAHERLVTLGLLSK